MSDWIGLIFIVLILVGGIFALVRANEASRRLTQEEYEERLQEGMGRSMLSAGVMGLQKILEPAVEKAVAVQQDFRAGHYDGGQESGEDKNRAKGESKK